MQCIERQRVWGEIGRAYRGGHMKKSIAVVALMIVASLSAVAQNRQLAKGEVTFGFVANNHEFAAGTYEIRQIGGHILRFQDVRTGEGVTLIANGTPAETPKVNMRFRNYAGQYFLEQVSSETMSAKTMPSEREMKLAREGRAATVVTLQAKR